MDKHYLIHMCWNGSTRQIYDTYDFGSDKWSWRNEIECMPFDIIDESDHECWFDGGDNDE